MNTEQHCTPPDRHHYHQSASLELLKGLRNNPVGWALSPKLGFCIVIIIPKSGFALEMYWTHFIVGGK